MNFAKWILVGYFVVSIGSALYMYLNGKLTRGLFIGSLCIFTGMAMLAIKA